MNNTKGMIIKNYTMHITMMLLTMLVTYVGSPMIGFIFGLLVYSMYIMLQYADGADRGEKACTLSYTIEKLQSENKNVEEEMLKQRYNKKCAVVAFLASSLPFALLAVANLIFADPTSVFQNALESVTRVVFMPVAWATRLLTDLVGWNVNALWENSANLYSAFLDYGAGFDLSLAAKAVDGGKVLAIAYDLHYLTILRVSFIVFAFVPPGAQMIGYFQGPKLRERKLKEIAKGTRKKRKKLKVFGSKKNTPKQMKPEV